MPIGLIVVICILTASVAMPICLAAHDRIEIGNKLENRGAGLGYGDLYTIGELYKGDKVKVVITNLRGDGDLLVYFSKSLLLNPLTADETTFSFPGDATFIAPEDGNYYLVFYCISGEKVIFKGYATANNRSNTKGG